MRDYLVIGATPAEEACAQVGSPDYKTRMIKEINAFINQLLRQFGPEPKGAEIRVKAFPHDFGTYHEVVVFFDDNNEEAVNYAYKIENEAATRWDEEALIELGLKKDKTEHIKLHKTYSPNIYYVGFDKLPKKAQKILKNTPPEIANRKYTGYEAAAFIRAEIEVNDALWDAEISLGSVDIRNSDYKYDDDIDAYVDDLGREIDADEYSEQFLNDLMSVIELENIDVFLTFIEDIDYTKKNPLERVQVKAKDRKSVSAKIRSLINEGYPVKQAVAMALSMYGSNRLGPKGGYKRARKKK